MGCLDCNPWILVIVIVLLMKGKRSRRELIVEGDSINSPVNGLKSNRLVIKQVRLYRICMDMTLTD